MSIAGIGQRDETQPRMRFCFPNWARSFVLLNSFSFSSYQSFTSFDLFGCTFPFSRMEALFHYLVCIAVIFINSHSPYSSVFVVSHSFKVYIKLLERSCHIVVRHLLLPHAHTYFFGIFEKRIPPSCPHFSF